MLAEFERRLDPGTQCRAIVHARNERGMIFWTAHGFAIDGELDTREHFAAHRGLSFEQPAEHEPSPILRRTVAAAAVG